MLLSAISYLFTAMVASLSLWSFFSDYKIAKIFRFGFWISLTFFVTAMLGWYQTFDSSQLLYLVRDLVYLSAVSLFFIVLKNLGVPKWLGILLLALSVGISYELSSKYWHSQSIVNNSDPKVKYADQEFLVELQESYDLYDLKALFQSKNIEISPAFSPKNDGSTVLDEYYIVDALDDQPDMISQVKERLSQSHIVAWYEPNEILELEIREGQTIESPDRSTILNDPLISQQWAADALNFSAFHETMEQMNLTGTQKSKLFILDSGVDAGHEDIQDNFIKTASKNDNDIKGHGTHCAGIAAATSNNGQGIASMNPSNAMVQIHSIKVMNNFGIGTQKSIIDGMIEAVDMGADVISMSLGGRSNQLREKAYNDAVKYATDHNCIVVVSAGNSSDHAKNFCPANAKGVITVSALDQRMNRASFSNYTNDIDMALSAPGVDIISTFPKDQYKAMSGTSMATPFVSGMIAVMKSIRPELTSQEAYDILDQTGQMTINTKETGKCIDPAAALRAVR